MEMDVEIDKFCNCSLDFRDENNTGPILNLEYEECHYLNGTIVDDHCKKYYPDIFLLSVLLFFATFLISITLKNFKSASFFPAKVRAFISDFAVIITIMLMTLIDFLIGIGTPKLWVPEELKPTSPTRGWIIPPFNGNPWWTSLLAFLPALLACILIFMDQQITSVIINRKEHRLKKGGGYHLDLFVLSILIVINSIMGLPWFVAATVLSINHVNSLKIESECAAPGEKPQFLGVRENRVTHLLIFLFIGLSVFMTPLLSRIPMGVLYGVFMYMGITALQGIQFFERILLIFIPAKYQPDRAFLRKIPLKRIHFIHCDSTSVSWSALGGKKFPSNLDFIPFDGKDEILC
ncbi:Electroneutral sodium bicarbonate exchanger 1 [Armadillidium nasatum]|uniref:Electroneutral sodium bicarbonate exchanger 1 n=1 Tax=Armadillidium nasatum TaxID=96803 RepID=A0A5N5SWB1_9CRUS|nr:Electroneutral sodium bicarbonate exchanger 1 [Armadillidium nasatum]